MGKLTSGWLFAAFLNSYMLHYSNASMGPLTRIKLLLTSFIVEPISSLDIVGVV